MPHSSGGGSHGGGSHGGSGFSGSHSSVGPRTSHRYFAGCRTYVYYRHRRPYYVYSDGPIGNESLGSKLLVMLFLLVFVGVVAFALWNTVKKPEPLKGTNIYSVEIIDDAHVLGETTKLEGLLVEFQEKSGVPTCIMTIDNTTWQSHYTSLEAYAYDKYCNKFTDEVHWLIVYSTDHSDFNDWYYEMMQGNNTDKILTEESVEDFQRTLDTNLRRTGTTVTQAFETAFEEYNDSVLDTHIDIVTLLLLSAVELFLVVITVAVFIQYTFKSYKKEELQEVKAENVSSSDGKAKTRNCEYCGGLYVVGAHESCPHCGATILSEDYNPEQK